MGRKKQKKRVHHSDDDDDDDDDDDYKAEATTMSARRRRSLSARSIHEAEVAQAVNDMKSTFCARLLNLKQSVDDLQALKDEKEKEDDEAFNHSLAQLEHSYDIKITSLVQHHRSLQAQKHHPAHTATQEHTQPASQVHQSSTSGSVVGTDNDDVLTVTQQRQV